MPGIMLPKNLTEDNRKFFNELSSVPEYYISTNTEDIAVEDNSYRDWLQKPDSDPFKEVNDFITKVALTDVGTSDELAALIDCRRAYLSLKKDLNMPTEGELTQERLDAVKDNLDTLLGEKAPVKGFADAINDFNKKTGYKYVAEPAVKTMLILANRVEKIAGSIEKKAYDEYVLNFNDYTMDAINNRNGIDDLNDSFDGYRAEFNQEFPDKEFADLFTFYNEKKAERDTLKAEYNKVTKEVEDTTKGLERLNTELAKVNETLERLNSDLAFNQENTKTAIADNEKSKKESVDNMIRAKLEQQVSTEAAEHSNRVNLLAAYKNEEIEKLNNKEEYKPVKDGLVEGIRIITTSAELLNEANSLGKLSKTDINSVLNGSFAQKFTKAYNDLHKQELENYSKKSGFGRLFSRRIPTAEEVLKETAEKCIKNDQSFGSAVKDSIRELRTTAKEHINKLGQTIGKDNLFAEYSKEYDKAPERAKQRLDAEIAAGKKNSEEFNKKSELDNRFAEYTDTAIEKLKKSKEAFEKDIVNEKAKMATLDKTIKYTKQKLADLQTKKDAAAQACGKADKELTSIDYYTGKVGNLYQDYAARIKSVNNFREKVFEARTDARPARFDRRVDALMNRLPENAKKGHTDSREYKTLVEKLTNLKDSGCTYDNAMELKDAANAYIKAKGTAKIFSRSSFGENRFNFAKEIVNMCENITKAAEDEYPTHDQKTVGIINELRTGNVASKLRPLPIRPEMRVNAPVEDRAVNLRMQPHNEPDIAAQNERQQEELIPEMGR